MKKYRVDYTITSTYRIDVEARSEDEARSMLEDGADIDLGDGFAEDEKLTVTGIQEWKK